MNQQDYILDAIDLVLAWDVPDENFAQVVNQQAHLMQGLNPDDFSDTSTD